MPMRGAMLWFNEAKEFGLIRTDDGERLYVHRSGFLPGHVPEGRCAGKLVSFEREPAAAAGEYSHQAVGVSVVDEAAPRRARRRRQGSFR